MHQLQELRLVHFFAPKLNQFFYGRTKIIIYEKLFFRIDVPAYQGIVFLNGNQLFVRHESSRRLLKDQDLISYINNRN